MRAIWSIITTVFLGVYGLMSFYVGSRGWSVLGKQAKRPYQLLYWVFFLLLVLSFPISELAEDILPESMAPWLTTWSGYTMVSVSYLFLMLLLVDILRLFQTV